MREILEEANEHKNDGYGRAQAHEKRILPRRFYKNVSVEQKENGFAILLDGRGVKTPSKKSLIVPNLNFANELVIEWQAQKEEIDAALMPLNRLANSAIEGEQGIEDALVEEIVKYASSDLLLYRSDSPQKLAKAQQLHWDKVLVDLAQKFEIKFMPTIGIIHQSQPQKTLKKLKKSLVGQNSFTLCALMSITSLSGSGLLAIALYYELLSADAAWSAAHVDEDFNINIWGQDEEAQIRFTKRRIEFDAALKLVELFKS